MDAMTSANSLAYISGKSAGMLDAAITAEIKLYTNDMIAKLQGACVNERVTSALIGARNVEQFDDWLDALGKLSISPDELREIDRHATGGGIDLWRQSSVYQRGLSSCQRRCKRMVGHSDAMML